MMKFATSLAIAGSLGQINAINVQYTNKAGLMERCGPSSTTNVTECQEEFKCEEKTFINSGGVAETNHVCQYGQANDVCYRQDPSSNIAYSIMCQPGARLECQALPGVAEGEKYCLEQRPSDAASIVAEHFVTYNWLAELESADQQETINRLRAHMEELRQGTNGEFDTVVRAFQGADGPDVIDEIAEGLAEGYQHPNSQAFWEKYRYDLTQGIAWAVEDLINDQTDTDTDGPNPTPVDPVVESAIEDVIEDLPVDWDEFLDITAGISKRVAEGIAQMDRDDLEKVIGAIAQAEYSELVDYLCKRLKDLDWSQLEGSSTEKLVEAVYAALRQ